MHVTLQDIQGIFPYACNPRHNQAAVAKVAASIREFGFQQPIVVDRDATIIVGHTRWLAAQQLGLKQVPIVVAAHLTPLQAKAYRLMDNRSHEEASWDTDLLPLELAALQTEDWNLALTGFDAQEIADYLALQENGAEKEGDVLPESLGSPRCQLGDLWQLGPHRLLCGDATSREAVLRLMGGEQGDLVFTDPPYNVDYAGYTPDTLTLQGDKHASSADFEHFLTQIFSHYPPVLVKTASLYVCHSALYQRCFQNALEAAGFTVRAVLIWAKHHFAWGYGRYKYQHEPIYYCHRQGESDAWYGDKTQSTLWQFDKPAANRLHPTMKPVALIEKALQNSSQPGDLVLDFCAGSGSTLIAAEKTGRRAYVMEKDPHYADVILDRWEQFSGQAAAAKQ